MKREVIGFLSFCIVFMTVAASQGFAANTAQFEQHFDAAQTYMNQGQYTSAIVEYRKALRINYMDNSARIGLVNSFLSRASYYANQEKNYEKAANDFRNAIFYLKMFPVKEQVVENSSGMIASAVSNLNQCLNVTGFDKTAKSRYKKAEELRAIGNFSAAAFEFSQAATDSNLASDSYSQIAELMKLLANETRAADYYKMALDLNPSNGLLRMKYARTLDKLGRYDAAVAEYNLALANSKGDMEILYNLERIYLKKLAQTPSDAELNANIGAIKQAQGDFDAALSYYGKAEQLNPSNVNTRLNVGTLFQQKGDISKAMKSYDSVLELYPDNLQANLYKAQLLSQTGDKNGALTLYKKVLSLEPANQIAKNESIKLMMDTMSEDEFIAYLNKNASDKTMMAMLYDYAYKLHKENKFKHAISAYKSVINNNPANVDAYVNMAICYASANDYKNAINTLNTAKSKFPSNDLVNKTLAEVKKDSVSHSIALATKNYENKDYQKAIDIYSSINPQTTDTLIGIAASYQAMENYNKAIEFYKKAFAMDSKNPDIPYYIGYLYSELQKWDEAEEYLTKANAAKSNPEIQNLLTYVKENKHSTGLNSAISLYEKNNYNEALKVLNKLLTENSKDPYAYYYRAMIYDEQKNFNLAISDYNNVLKYTEDIPIVNYMLAVDYDNSEKYKEALKYYNIFISKYNTEDDFLNYAKTRIEELKAYAG